MLLSYKVIEGLLLLSYIVILLHHTSAMSSLYNLACVLPIGCVVLVYIGDFQCKNRNNDAYDASGDNVHGMVEIVTDPSERDPERQHRYAELEEGTDDLEDPDAPVDELETGTGEAVQSGLKVEHEEGGAVEAERAVA